MISNAYEVGGAKGGGGLTLFCYIYPPNEYIKKTYNGLIGVATKNIHIYSIDESIFTRIISLNPL